MFLLLLHVIEHFVENNFELLVRFKLSNHVCFSDASRNGLEREALLERKYQTGLQAKRDMCKNKSARAGEI